MILYALLCGYLPFDEDSNSRLHKLILTASYTFPDFISDSARPRRAGRALTARAQARATSSRGCSR